jgi:hypothetical protein
MEKLIQKNYQINNLKKILKKEIRFFLISIAIISLFSKPAECGFFEKVMDECNDKEEIIEISENFIEILKKNKKNNLENLYKSDNEKRREVNLENSFPNFYIFGLESNEKEEFYLEKIREECLEKIKNLIEKEDINVKELDIELNKKNKN